MPMLNRKGKASEYFSPHQLGVACQYGVEKVVHGLRCCVEEQGNEDDLVVTKIDLRNAFNLVSRQMLLDECNLQFSELFPWAAWFSLNVLCHGYIEIRVWSPTGQSIRTITIGSPQS